MTLVCFQFTSELKEKKIRDFVQDLKTTGV